MAQPSVVVFLAVKNLSVPFSSRLASSRLPIFLSWAIGTSCHTSKVEGSTPANFFRVRPVIMGNPHSKPRPSRVNRKVRSEWKAMNFSAPLSRRSVVSSRRIWTDGGYSGPLESEVANLKRHRQIELGIVKRSDKGFKILPKRWIVERTFGWLVQSRRLIRDHEARIEHYEALIYLSMTSGCSRGSPPR